MMLNEKKEKRDKKRRTAPVDDRFGIPTEILQARPAPFPSTTNTSKNDEKEEKADKEEK